MLNRLLVLLCAIGIIVVLISMKGELSYGEKILRDPKGTIYEVQINGVKDMCYKIGFAVTNQSIRVQCEVLGGGREMSIRIDEINKGRIKKEGEN